MRVPGKAIITIICLAAWMLGAPLAPRAADLQFTASVDRTAISLSETLTLTFEVQSGGLSAPDPKLPDLSDFRTISGPNQSSTFQLINGRTSSSKIYTLILQPRREGTLTIGAAELVYDKKRYQTEPIAISVASVGSAPPPQTQSTPSVPTPRSAASGDDLFVQVSADKNQAYQNEQVVLTYTIYTKISVSAYEISKLPAMPGFWVEEFPAPPQGPDVRDVVIGGTHYRAAVIRRVALFPTRTGELRIDPLEVTCQVQVRDTRRRSRDPFDLLFDDPFSRFRTQEKLIATDPLSLRVLPLPEAGKPANFSGAVGDFDLDVSLDRRAASTNEALTMTVRCSGSGNIKMLPPPDFRAPPDFEAYEPKESVQVNKSGSRVSGAKTYEYVFIPRFPGKQKLPAISFSYFDPAAKSYRTLTEGGFELTIGQGSSNLVTIPAGVSKEEVKLIGEDIRYLKSVGRLQPLTVAGRLPAGHWLGMILPPILGALFMAAVRFSGTAPVQARWQARRAYARAQRDLRQLARIAASNPSARDRFMRFYGGAHRALISYLGEKLQLPARGLKEDDVMQQIQDRGVSPQRTAEIRDIFNTCNLARFAVGNEDASIMDQTTRRLRHLIDDLEGGWEKSA
jgi:hypothetical protein